MKKLLSIVFSVVLFASVFSGCGKAETERILYNNVDLSKIVELGDYKNIPVDTSTDDFKEYYDELDRMEEAYKEDFDEMYRQHQDELDEMRLNIDEQQKRIKEIDAEIFRLAEPYSYALDLIRTTPGLNKDSLTAIRILSEIGADMSAFPTSKHLVSWAGCCPRNDKSAKNIKGTRISRAGSYLKPILVQIANALLKSKDHPEFLERYRRIKARRGHKKAIIAVCRMLLTAIWNILSKLEPYTAKGYLADKVTEHSVVITKAQGLELLRKRGYIFKEELADA